MSEPTADLIGKVAVSKAGRDQARAFLITAVIDENYVFLVDGCLRKLDRPKRKKRKHLSIQPAVAETIKNKLLEGKQVFDAEIRNCLMNLGYNVDHQS